MGRAFAQGFSPKMPRIGFARLPYSNRTINLREGGRIVVEGLRNLLDTKVGIA